MRTLLIQELHHARACVVAHEIHEARRHIAVARSLYESAASGTLPPQVGSTIAWAERSLVARELTVVAMALDQGLRVLDEVTGDAGTRSVGNPVS
jgi:hypothetical protein